jgi:hypothetical protein
MGTSPLRALAVRRQLGGSAQRSASYDAIPACRSRSRPLLSLLLARRNGLISFEAENRGGSPVGFTLQPDETVKDRIVEMTPEATILGACD